MPIFTPVERLGASLSNRYRIERILAVGGMGVVFGGTDLKAGRPIAVKVLKGEDGAGRSRRGSRFLEEARLTVGLRHAHVVEVLDFGHDEWGAPYLVMELLKGESLEALLARRVTLPPSEALEIVLPVLGALAHVHDAGIVHRDVKPDNVFLARGAHGEVIPKLLDFGIAKSSDSAIGTREGAVLGTPEYMAPEQLAGHSATSATDVWGAAAVLYRCASGRAPYAGAHAGEVLARLSRDAPPRLEAREYPAAVRAAIDRALFREPSGRYATMRGFAAALVLTARECGVPVSEALAVGAGLDGFDWATAFSVRTMSSTGVVPTPSSRRWAFPALAFSALVLGGWVAVRHAGELGAEPAQPPSVSSVAAPGVAETPAVIESREGEPLESPAEPSTTSSSAAAPAKPSRSKKGRMAARAVPTPSSSAAPAAKPSRDDLPVVTEW